MKIRNKILLYFSATVILLTAVSFSITYILFSEYREEDFQQRQKEKVKYTIQFLTEFKAFSKNIAGVMDELTIHDFYDEKLLVFDQNKKQIFASIDDLTIQSYQSILNELSPTKKWIETKEGNYDLIGIFYEHDNQHFYAISKAYDPSGYSKLYFLRNVLIALFIAVIVVVVLISLFISNKVSKPIIALAKKLNDYDLSQENSPMLTIETSSYELKQLTERFNELINRTNEAFAFQKHTVHHISHQLKTPIAILVSELEKIKNYTETDAIKSELESQIIKAKSLGSIINVLLEIAKTESGQQLKKQKRRIDELTFDVIDELQRLYPDFHFEVNYSPAHVNENKLIVNLNAILIKQAVANLLTNCIAYSNNGKGEIIFNCLEPNWVKIQIINSGNPITKEEELFLFKHFFRGKNSQGKPGFGLGLVLTKKIIELNEATISYTNKNNRLNIFEINLPLS